MANRVEERRAEMQSEAWNHIASKINNDRGLVFDRTINVTPYNPLDNDNLTVAYAQIVCQAIQDKAGVKDPRWISSDEGFLIRNQMPTVSRFDNQLCLDLPLIAPVNLAEQRGALHNLDGISGIAPIEAMTQDPALADAFLSQYYAAEFQRGGVDKDFLTVGQIDGLTDDQERVRLLNRVVTDAVQASPVGLPLREPLSVILAKNEGAQALKKALTRTFLLNKLECDGGAVKPQHLSRHEADCANRFIKDSLAKDHLFSLAEIARQAEKAAEFSLRHTPDVCREIDKRNIARDHTYAFMESFTLGDNANLSEQFFNRVGGVDIYTDELALDYDAILRVNNSIVLCKCAFGNSAIDVQKEAMRDMVPRVLGFPDNVPSSSSPESVLEAYLASSVGKVDVYPLPVNFDDVNSIPVDFRKLAIQSDLYHDFGVSKQAVSFIVTNDRFTNGQEVDRVQLHKECTLYDTIRHLDRKFDSFMESKIKHIQEDIDNKVITGLDSFDSDTLLIQLDKYSRESKGLLESTFHDLIHGYHDECGFAEPTFIRSHLENELAMMRQDFCKEFNRQVPESLQTRCAQGLVIYRDAINNKALLADEAMLLAEQMLNAPIIQPDELMPANEERVFSELNIGINKDAFSNALGFRKPLSDLLVNIADIVNTDPTIAIAIDEGIPLVIYHDEVVNAYCAFQSGSDLHKEAKLNPSMGAAVAVVGRGTYPVGVAPDHIIVLRSNTNDAAHLTMQLSNLAQVVDHRCEADFTAAQVNNEAFVSGIEVDFKGTLLNADVRNELDNIMERTENYYYELHTSLNRIKETDFKASKDSIASLDM